jgi:hypothetical protein
MPNLEGQQVLVDNRKRGWFWDYNEVFGSGLTVYAIAVRLYLARRANKSMDAWPSLNTIAKDCSISRPTVVKALCELENKGWVHRVVRKNNGEYDTTIYHLEDPPAFLTSERGCKGDLQPCKNIDRVVNDINNPVNDVDNLVNHANNPCKGDLQGVVNDVDSKKDHITIPIQQQRLISDHRSIVDLADDAKNGIVVGQSTQIAPAPEPGETQAASQPMTGAEKKEAGARPDESGGPAEKSVRPATAVERGAVEKREDGSSPAVAEIIDYAASKGFEVPEDCARDFLAAATSAERAKKAVDRAAISASAKVRRGEQIHNTAGLLFKALSFNSGAKLDLKNLDSERKKRLAEKEDKYRDLYVT